MSNDRGAIGALRSLLQRHNHTGGDGSAALVAGSIPNGIITPDKLSLAHFSARRGASTGGVTGNGTAYTVVFDTAIISNAAYATGTGIYTAPATGAYQFNVLLGMVAGGAAQTNAVVTLVTTARTYRWDFDPFTGRNLTSGGNTIGFSVVADMALNDTARVILTIAGGPSDSAIVIGNTSSFFSGFRIA